MKFFGPSGGTTVVEPYATGDIALLDTGAHDGFLPCDGTLISEVALPALAAKLGPAPVSMGTQSTSSVFPTLNTGRLNNVINVGYGSFMYANGSGASAGITTDFGSTWTQFGNSPSMPARGLHKMDNGTFLIFHTDSSYSTCASLWGFWSNYGAVLPNIWTTSLSVRVPGNYIRVSSTGTTYAYGWVSTGWATGALTGTCPAPAFSSVSSDGRIAIYSNYAASSGTVYVFNNTGGLVAAVPVSAASTIYGVQMYADGTKFTIYANNGWFKTYNVSTGTLLSTGSIPGFSGLIAGAFKTFKDLAMNETFLLTTTGDIALMKEPGDATGCVFTRVPENVQNAIAACVEPLDDVVVSVCSDWRSFPVNINRNTGYSQTPSISPGEAGKTWYIKQ